MKSCCTGRGLVQRYHIGVNRMFQRCSLVNKSDNTRKLLCNSHDRAVPGTWYVVVFEGEHAENMKQDNPWVRHEPYGRCQWSVEWGTYSYTGACGYSYHTIMRSVRQQYGIVNKYAAKRYPGYSSFCASPTSSAVMMAILNTFTAWCHLCWSSGVRAPGVTAAQKEETAQGIFKYRTPSQNAREYIETLACRLTKKRMYRMIVMTLCTYTAHIKKYILQQCSKHTRHKAQRIPEVWRSMIPNYVRSRPSARSGTTAFRP